ncbi:hypothetical protein, partial [Klebsiella pneumoniae]|uniref:hypothetical protein n=1 Tax=Klebsiella pneumoniae TaxID=573 RepID=UPI001E29A098
LSVLTGSLEVTAQGVSSKLKAGETARYAVDGPHLIRNGRLEADSARPFVPDPEVAADGQVPTDEPGWIVPLATWKASHA